MTTHLELDRETEKLKELSKRWRNRWRAKFDVENLDTGARLPRGSEHWDAEVWPSREVAEEKAAREMADPEFSDVWAYVGAFPVDAA